MNIQWLDADIGQIVCCGNEITVTTYDSTDPPEPCETCGKAWIVIPASVMEYTRPPEAT